MFEIGIHICNEIKDSEIVIKKLEINERNDILKSVLMNYFSTSKHLK